MFTTKIHHVKIASATFMVTPKKKNTVSKIKHCDDWS